jgi:adenosine kinase
MIAVTGSVAYDYIMTFEGVLKDHLLTDNTGNLSVSFFTPQLEKHFGGTAGNIAYNLSLIDEEVSLIGTLGKDYKDYFEHLESIAVKTKHLTTINDDITASAYILTDKEDNQITSFYGGAMLKANEKNISKVAPDFAIIAATEGETMKKHCQNCIDNNIPYVFDPGQSLPIWDKENLKKYIEASHITIVNEYELSLIANMLEIKNEEVKSLIKTLIVTLGENGSTIYENGKKTSIPVIKVDKAIDPTGCGDAYRAGLLYGLTHNISLEDACKMGAAIASFAVEKKGTQKHAFTKEDLEERMSFSL